MASTIWLLHHPFIFWCSKCLKHLWPFFIHVIWWAKKIEIFDYRGTFDENLADCIVSTEPADDIALLGGAKTIMPKFGLVGLNLNLAKISCSHFSRWITVNFCVEHHFDTVTICAEGLIYYGSSYTCNFCLYVYMLCISIQFVTKDTL